MQEFAWKHFMLQERNDGIQHNAGCVWLNANAQTMGTVSCRKGTGKEPYTIYVGVSAGVLFLVGTLIG